MQQRSKIRDDEFMSTKPQVKEYFTGLANDYDAHRPSYPARAIAAIVEGLQVPVRAVDVGCGTGISTRLLAKVCDSVIGIDPNQDMLQQARTSRVHANARYQQGSAEHTGLADASVNLVLCAQAFHWFDADAALREFGRVLERGGRLALMWNAKTEENRFSEVFCDVAKRAQADARSRGLKAVEDRDFDLARLYGFANARRLAFPNNQRLDLNGALGRMRSASYFPRSGSLRDELERELAAAFHENEQAGCVTLTHQTIVIMGESEWLSK